MKNTVTWIIDIFFTRIHYGPYKQENYHYYMLEKWGPKYSKYYIKNMIYDDKLGGYRDIY